MINRTLNLTLLLSLLSLATNAQIIPDNSLGSENSRVRRGEVNNLDSDIIEGGAIRGENLFHSFQEFNINEGRGAYFANPQNIQHIFSRVTGNNVSNILGTLGVLGEANLILINPNGIIFGPNASIDIRGAFRASTADSILFNNNYQFSATNPDTPPLLTIDIPLGLRFRDNPTPITNQAQLSVPGDLSLSGGDVFIYGSIRVGGQLNLEAKNDLIIENNVDIFAPGGEVNLSSEGDIEIRGVEINVAGSEGGEITLSGNNITVEEAEVRAGIGSGLGNPESQAGDITIEARGDLRVVNGGYIANEVAEGGIGNGGDVNVIANSVEVVDGGIIGAGTSGEGNAGSVSINAQSLVKVEGGEIGFSLIFSQVNPNAVGNAGGVEISADSVEVVNGGIIGVGTFGEGNASTVIIDAQEIVKVEGGEIGFGLITTQVSSGAIGIVGGMNISANSVEVLNGGTIAADTFGEGNAGSVIIETEGLVKVEGGENGLSFITSDVNSGAVGNAGGVNISANSVEVLNGAEISADTSGEGNASTVIIDAQEIVKVEGGENGLSFITSDVNSGAVGNAGGVNISANSVEVLNGAEISADTSGIGDGGSVIIDAQEIVKVEGGENGLSFITSDVNSGAVGNAGGVNISANSVEVLNGAEISADTSGIGDGGSVIIDAQEIVKVEGGEIGFSFILSSTRPGAIGNAGGVKISANSVEVLNGGVIDASIFGEGDAGSVIIEAEDLMKVDGGELGSSFISSSTQIGAIGNAGGVEISANSVEVINGGTIAADTFGEGDAGNVSIEVEGLVKVEGGENGISFITSDVNSGAVGNAGGVEISADSIEVLNRGNITASTFGEGDAGTVSINAQDLVIEGGENGSSFITSSVSSVAVGDAGGVEISADSIEVLNGGQIRADTFGEGDAGTVSIEAQDLVIEGGENGSSFITSSVSSVAMGDAGGVEISADSIEVLNRGQIRADTFGEGDAGTVSIEAQDLVIEGGENGISFISSDVNSGAVGNAGGVEISADSVEVLNRGNITASTFGEGDAGTVSINAQELVKVEGGELGFSTISTQVNSGAVGDAGGVEISADSVEVLNDGQISASTFGEGDAGTVSIEAQNLIIEGGELGFSIISSSVQPDAVGNAGGVEISANSVEVLNDGQIDSNTLGEGDAGDLIINTPQLSLDNDSQVSVNAESTGNPGNLNITGDNLTSTNNSQISATSTSGFFGNITLNLNGTVLLQNNSSINTESGGIGNGGDIALDSQFLILFDSNIIANAFEGNGGNINITVSNLFLDNQSVIEASSERGIDGEIDTNVTETDPSEGLVDLPQNIIDASALIGQNFCSQSSQSEFTITGRGGLPKTPEQIPTSEDVEVGLIAPTTEETPEATETNKPIEYSEIVPAMGMVRNAQGDIVLVAEVTQSDPTRQVNNPYRCPPN